MRDALWEISEYVILAAQRQHVSSPSMCICRIKEADAYMAIVMALAAGAC